MKPEKTLEKETKKWLSRIENELPSAKKAKLSRPAKEQMENVHAYIKDCRYFLEKNDYINAFEAIIYAWGIYETLLRLGLLEKEEK
ncbi:MAG: DUF357 domain-containing protein [Candidatus Aenigmarchaeota archaeon]|nr:DUF357 domain-containing protein [Candidatus Aenigmarchaeota archaeon]